MWYSWKKLCCLTSTAQHTLAENCSTLVVFACMHICCLLMNIHNMCVQDRSAKTVYFFCCVGQQMQFVAQPPLQAVKLPPTPSSAVLQQAPAEATGPEGLTILLSRVALGNSTRGSSDMRRPPEGYDSTTNIHSMRGRNHHNKMDIYCVYDNAQAYPAYIITYRANRDHAMC